MVEETTQNLFLLSDIGMVQVDATLIQIMKEKHFESQVQPRLKWKINKSNNSTEVFPVEREFCCRTA